MKLSIVIISYNTNDLLRQCLENLAKVKDTFFDTVGELEVIVVDNASVDGSAQMVENTFAWVQLIKNSENTGLAKGGNIGFNASHGDYILYLGSDAFPTLETLEGLVSYMAKNSEVGIATCKLVLRTGKPDMDAHRGFPTPWAALTHFLGLDKMFPKSKLFGSYFLGWANLSLPHEIDLCISHFMLVKRKALEQINGWDEVFFVFGEDVDFCYRIKQAGWKIMYLPQWQTVHYKGAGVGRKESKDIKTVSNQSSETAMRMRNEKARAMKLFYEKHYKGKYPKVVTWFVLWAIK